MVLYTISKTKRYSNSSYPSEIWYSGNYGGSYVSGYLSYETYDGHWEVTYSGDVTGKHR